MALETNDNVWGDDDGSALSEKAKALRAAALEKSASKGSAIGTGVGALAGLVAAIYTGQPQLVGVGASAGGVAGGAIATGGKSGSDLASAAGSVDKIYEAFKKSKKSPDLSKMTKEQLSQHLLDNPEVVDSQEYTDLMSGITDSLPGVED